MKAFNFIKVAGSEGFILSNGLGFIDLVKYIDLVFNKIAGFYSSFSNYSLWDICKASGKRSLKLGPLYTTASRRVVKYLQRARLQWIYTVKFSFVARTPHVLLLRTFSLCHVKKFWQFLVASHKYTSTVLFQLNSL